MSPIAYICSTRRCHRLLTKPGRCAYHEAEEKGRRRAKLREQGQDSPHWVKLRRMVKIRDGHRCVVCGTSENLTVHLNPHRGGDHYTAGVDDCITICKYDHAVLHNKLRARNRRGFL